MQKLPINRHCQLNHWLHNRDLLTRSYTQAVRSSLDLPAYQSRRAPAFSSHASPWRQEERLGRLALRENVMSTVSEATSRPTNFAGFCLVGGASLAALTEAIPGTVLSFARLDMMGKVAATADEFARKDFGYTTAKLIGFVMTAWLSGRFTLASWAGRDGRNWPFQRHPWRRIGLHLPSGRDFRERS
jgi:hypothetical protein